MKLNNKLFSTVTILIALAFSSQAMATATTAADMANNGSGQLGAITSLILGAAGLAGVVLAIGGLLGIRNAKQQGDGYGKHIGGIILGAALFSIVAIITVANTSFFGSDTSQDVQSRIIQ